jgi:hypothetical protein
MQAYLPACRENQWLGQRAAMRTSKQSSRNGPGSAPKSQKREPAPDVVDKLAPRDLYHLHNGVNRVYLEGSWLDGLYPSLEV